MSKLLFLSEKLRQPDEPDFHTVRVSDTCGRGLGDYVILEHYNMFSQADYEFVLAQKKPCQRQGFRGMELRLIVVVI